MLSFCTIGLVYIGCFLSPEAQPLHSCEGLTNELQDDPMLRSEPVRKCGSAALNSGYTMFALALGECCSGSSIVGDYTVAGEAFNCTDGRGGLGENGVVLLDVYEMSDQAAFLESARKSQLRGMDYCLSETVPVEGEDSKITEIPTEDGSTCMCSRGQTALSLSIISILIFSIVINYEFF